MRLMDAAIQKFIQTEEYYDSVQQRLEAAAPAERARLNGELLTAYAQLESLARVVAGLEFTHDACFAETPAN
jgi:hypothetical protein